MLFFPSIWNLGEKRKKKEEEEEKKGKGVWIVYVDCNKAFREQQNSISLKKKPASPKAGKGEVFGFICLILNAWSMLHAANTYLWSFSLEQTNLMLL